MILFGLLCWGSSPRSRACKAHIKPHPSLSDCFICAGNLMKEIKSGQEQRNAVSPCVNYQVQKIQCHVQGGPYVLVLCKSFEFFRALDMVSEQGLINSVLCFLVVILCYSKVERNSTVIPRFPLVQSHQSLRFCHISFSCPRFLFFCLCMNITEQITGILSLSHSACVPTQHGHFLMSRLTKLRAVSGIGIAGWRPIWVTERGQLWMWLSGRVPQAQSPSCSHPQIKTVSCISSSNL